MESLFQDGRVVWIESKEVLNNGDIGIFFYDGNVFCKKLVITSERAILRSLNADFEDVEINENFGFKTIGKVVA